MTKQSDEQFSEAETERRFKGALKRMLATPHQPHSESAKPRKKKATKSAPAKPKSRAPKRGPA